MQLRFLITLLFCVGTLRAQIDTRVSPVPPPAGQTQSQVAPKWTGPSLKGFLDETLGSGLQQGLETSLDVSQSATNQQLSLRGTGYVVDGLSRITGTISLHHDWSRASFLTQYAAGTDIYLENSYLNNQFHQVSAAEAFRTGGWNLSLGQHFDYLPQSSFGFNPQHVIGNGIFTNNQLGNAPGVDFFLPANVIERMVSTDASAEYLLGARSGVTLTGGFSDLYFSGVRSSLFLVDSQMVTAGAQYSSALDGSNTIGCGYAFSQGRSIGLSNLIRTHSATATYQYKLRDQLTLRVAAGPQVTRVSAGFSDVDLGTSTTVTASADYRLQRIDFGAYYFRGTNPSSGVLLGTKSNDIRGFVTRELGRNLQASASVGYAQNDSLGIVEIRGSQQIKSTYLTGTVEKSFSAMFSFHVSYSFQEQDNTAGFCKAGCSIVPMTHSGTIGLRFHIHPLTLRP